MIVMTIFSLDSLLEMEETIKGKLSERCYYDFLTYALDFAMIEAKDYAKIDYRGSQFVMICQIRRYEAVSFMFNTLQDYTGTIEYLELPTIAERMTILDGVYGKS